MDHGRTLYELTPSRASNQNPPSWQIDNSARITSRLVAFATNIFLSEHAPQPAVQVIPNFAFISNKTSFIEKSNSQLVAAGTAHLLSLLNSLLKLPNPRAQPRFRLQLELFGQFFTF
jgi:hypothetical protein